MVKLCPQCGLNLHRSRAKNFREKLIRLFTPYKAYRCHECRWRGWIADEVASRRFVDRRKQLRVIVSVLTTAILALLVIYVIRAR